MTCFCTATTNDSVPIRVCRGTGRLSYRPLPPIVNVRPGNQQKWQNGWPTQWPQLPAMLCVTTWPRRLWEEREVHVGCSRAINHGREWSVLPLGINIGIGLPGLLATTTIGRLGHVLSSALMAPVLPYDCIARTNAASYSRRQHRNPTSDRG